MALTIIIFNFQKNPGTIRIPEEDLGSEFHEMDHLVSLDLTNATHLKMTELCKDAGKVLFQGTNPKLLLRGKVYANFLIVLEGKGAFFVRLRFDYIL